MRTKYPPFKLTYLTAVFALLFLVSFGASAQTTYTFNGPATDWNTASNWSPATAPSSTNASSGTIIIINSNVTVSKLTIKSGVTLIVNSPAFLTVGTAGNSATNEVVDFQNGSIVNINSGSSLKVYGLLNNSNNSNKVTINGSISVVGNVTVGNGSTMTGSGNLSSTGSVTGAGTVFGSTDDCTTGCTYTCTSTTTSSASSTPSLCINTALTPITHNTTGATGIGTVTGLPAGTTASWSSNTITISGTPSASGTFNYSIPLTGGCATINATGTITVNAIPTQPTLTISSQPSCTSSSGTISISNYNPSFNYSVSPYSSNIQISGSTITATSGSYTIKAISGLCPIASNTITINPQPTTPTTPTVTLTQPTCAVATGTIVITTPTGSGMTYSIDGTNYTNTTGTFNSVNTGTYNVTAKNTSGCVSTSTVVTLSGATPNTWTGHYDNDWFKNGNWSTNHVPTSNDCAIIPAVTNSPMINITTSNNITSAYAYSITVASGATLTIASKNSLTVTNEIDVDPNGKFILEDSAGLIQINDETKVTNKGNITVHRTTSPTLLNDYTYWSSPTTGSQTLLNFAKDSNPKYFLAYENKWIYLNASTTTFEKGIGYAILTPKNSSSTTTSTMDYQFTGTPNNGNISVLATPATGTSSYKMVGNPYPSAISADEFILANLYGRSGAINQTITGTIYFWTHNNSASNGSYQSTDYATYTLSGGTRTGVNGHANNKSPEFYIASGQGFVVGTKATGNITFTNDMRVGVADEANNSNFYRSASATAKYHKLEKNRIWINISDDKTNFSQILLGYIENATNDYDPGFDGAYRNDSKFALYSLIGNSPYTIQAKGLPFSDADVFPLGFKTSTKGDLKISIDNVDGLFAQGQNVYIEDKLTNTTHNLSSAPYSFTTEAGTFNDRFTIKYTNGLEPTLGLGTFEENQNNVSITSKNQTIEIKSQSDNIKKAYVYDLSGKQLFENNNIDNSETTITNLGTEQIYIVKVILTNGQSYSKKVIY